MSIILLLLAIPFLVLACALLTRGAGLPPLAQAVVTGAALLAYLAVITVYVVCQVRRLGRRFDSVMAAAGLKFVRRELATCLYEGVLGGNPAAARVTPAYRFEPWRVEVSVTLSSGCRIALGSARPLLDCREAERLSFAPDSSLRELHVYADDHKEARRVLENPAIRKALHALLDNLQAANSWELYLQPGQIWLRARGYSVSDEAAAAWLQGVRNLALG